MLERVYPVRWISPKLYKAGQIVSLELGGYETAVYEIYPADEASWPLPAGVVFGAVSVDGTECTIDLFEKTEKVKLLNPDMVEEVTSGGEAVDLGRLDLAGGREAAIVDGAGFKDVGGGDFTVSFELDEQAVDAQLAILVETVVKDGKVIQPEVEIVIDGEIATPGKQGDRVPWSWYTVAVDGGAREALISIEPGEGAESWDGKVSAWIVAGRTSEPVRVSFRMKEKNVDRPMPAGPWPAGVRRVETLLGSAGGK